MGHTAYPFPPLGLDGTFDRRLRLAQAEADAAGGIDRLVSVDSTIMRAHQHAAGIIIDTDIGS
ncbi:hypothetical protein [Streptomyces lutosisoli]|uniref:Transposase n=1 Tax=Streptomyces lutosisoli TaxID=2665721 RepID=A0ABW2VRC4_9ACTN